jgi:chemotaxis protein methyltransferase CheR
MINLEVQDLTREEYELFRALVYEHSGINLGDQKLQLVRARLGKRMRSGNFSSYRAYYEYVKGDASGRELTHLIDAISTNTTHLFRENQHFEFLARTVKGWLDGDRRRSAPLRIWSAACSSGEEPYSIAMVMDDLRQRHSDLQYKILATDISSRMLERAQRGVFAVEALANVPPEFKRRYFARVGSDGDVRMQIVPQLRKSIRFAPFNLMSAQFPFRNGLDVIFCRNVMIYFDRSTQQTLVGKLCNVLNPGGYLLIGHSESLNSISHTLSYVMPTVYRRP